MERRIDLLEESYTTRVIGRPGAHQVQVGEDEYQKATLTPGPGGQALIQVGENRAEIHMVSQGERTFIRAFGRTFSLDIVDPVDQASREAGGRQDTARAPMPGTLVEVHVAPGEAVERSQPLVTIESMKILTLIPAPRTGTIQEICFEPGDNFEKNAALGRLAPREEN